MHTLKSIQLSVTCGRAPLITLTFTRETSETSWRFVFFKDEFEHFGDRRIAFNDLGYWMSLGGDTVHLLYASPPTCRDTYVTLPVEIRQQMVVRAHGLLAQAESLGKESAECAYTDELRDWCKVCGRGKARIEWDDTTKNFYQEQIQQPAEKDARLPKMLRHCVAIARNTTRKRTEHAQVRVSKDWDGFYFLVRDSQGHQIINGGIINHGGRWSIHT